MTNGIERELRERSFREAKQQSLTAIVAYVLLWAIVCASTNLAEAAPLFFRVNTALLLSTTLLRVCAAWRARHADRTSIWAKRLLMSAVLLNACHWGGMRRGPCWPPNSTSSARPC